MLSLLLQDGSLQPVSGAATPAHLVGGTTTSSESGDYAASYYGNNHGGGNGTDISASLNTTAGMDAYTAQQVQVDICSLIFFFFAFIFTEIACFFFFYLSY